MAAGSWPQTTDSVVKQFAELWGNQPAGWRRDLYREAGYMLLKAGIPMSCFAHGVSVSLADFLAMVESRCWNCLM